MTRKKVISYIIFTIMFTSFKVFCTEQKMLKRNIAIMPVYYMNYEKEYEYLSSIIRDVLKSKLLTVEKFNLTSFNIIDNKAYLLKIKPKDLSINNKIVKLSLQSGSDIAINTKYAVSKGKVIIIVDVVDILTGRSIITSSKAGRAGIDIFESINSVADDILYQSEKIIQKISEENLIKQIIQAYGKDKYIVFSRQKDEVKKEKELISRFFGINIGTGYDECLDIASSSGNIFKKKENYIVLKGSFTGYNNVEYSIFYFNNNLLTDMTIILNYPSQISSDMSIYHENELSIILGDDTKQNFPDKIIWSLDNKQVELSTLTGKKGYSYYYINYSTEKKYIPLTGILPELIEDKTNFKNAISCSIGGNFSYSPININNIILPGSKPVFTLHQSFQFAPAFNFNYFFNTSYSLGFEIVTGYELNIITYPNNFASKSDGDSIYFETSPLYHDLYNEIRLVQKMGPKSSNTRLIFALGGFYTLRFVTTLTSYSSRHHLGLNLEDKTVIDGEYNNQISLPDYYTFGGPTLFLGFEKRNKDRTLNISLGGIFRVGISSFDVNEYTFEEVVTDYSWSGTKWVETKEVFNFFADSYNTTFLNFNAGIEFKVMFNYFKVTNFSSSF